ncbi:bifunctional 4-hydroxy-2-oxoglutarate aldolase/2-dehydro-3-deoxy-phosphogluconate aldolase [Variovorax ginsengisoli]|uniref:2-dehydro-3-deoxy-phosphogluconate aldolase n=1 Tax=Variovorax ginsengisoli TaxID=363844 RepID=A0ABT8SGX2_9BURK|nr:bifunctional 4-hydroxy-2-oxoglutarate aldolase/2-dehydro-3-deoxy-phosphogluconate aldolase [Variovorax ginsengisoli]MDN8618885.1 bifunctional 4-hydroxy-2-oxoglutarate aldolase/2-dehydro-3-deoxy-phosphogluconate aldolase [Variovorax ginsengisoli]MDO1538055.1 bifunctional 4-hydroxy-2-oxoglutarate aldolase/2-dehydro-3-deoxy-phosphogluconate aldolase [Variovorax ginsengisoli]
MNILSIMRSGPVIPVIVIDRLEDAVPLARALVTGGVRVLELTLRTPVALKAIEAIANEVEGAIIGVGTITRPEDFDASVKAGALFGVSPGLTPELVAASRDSSLPLLPGVMTPSDVIAARAAGFTELKLFPAQQAGGVGMLKALGGPFPELSFCPTGGIGAATAPDFLALPNVVCVGGSWLTPGDAVAARDWGRITALAQDAARLGQTA